VKGIRTRGRHRNTWKEVADNNLMSLRMCASAAQNCKIQRKLIRGKQSHSDDESRDGVHFRLICCRCQLKWVELEIGH